MVVAPSTDRRENPVLEKVLPNRANFAEPYASEQLHVEFDWKHPFGGWTVSKTLLPFPERGT